MAEDLTPDSEPQQMTDADYKKLLGAGADGDFDPLSVPPEAGADIAALQTKAARQRMADIAKLPSEITGHTSLPQRTVAAATSEVFQSPVPAPLPEYRQPMGPVSDPVSAIDVLTGEVHHHTEGIQPATQPTGAEAAVTAQIPPVSATEVEIMGSTPSQAEIDRQMTPEQQEAQRRSFAYGNANIANEQITRDHINTAADELPLPPPPAPPVDTHRAGGTEFLPQPDPARAHVPEQPQTWNAIEASRAPVPARAATQDEIVAYLQMRVKDLEHTKATNQSLGAKDMSAVHRRLEFLRDDILPAITGLRG